MNALHDYRIYSHTRRVFKERFWWQNQGVVLPAHNKFAEIENWAEFKPPELQVIALHLTAAIVGKLRGNSRFHLIGVGWTWGLTRNFPIQGVNRPTAMIQLTGYENKALLLLTSAACPAPLQAFTPFCVSLLACLSPNNWFTTAN